MIELTWSDGTKQKLEYDWIDDEWGEVLRKLGDEDGES